METVWRPNGANTSNTFGKVYENMEMKLTQKLSNVAARWRQNGDTIEIQFIQNGDKHGDNVEAT